MNIKNSKFTLFHLPASQAPSQLAVRSGCARCKAAEFLHSKGNHVGFTKMLF